MSAFLDQEALCRAIPGLPVWVDIGGHESVGWAARKAAEVAHISGCGLKCPPLCGAAAEILGIAGVRARYRGDLIVPPIDTSFSLKEVLTFVTFGVGASCGAMVVDDLGAILSQQPPAEWWRSFAEAANAATEDGVKVLLLAAPKDLSKWPAGLPKAGWVLSGDEWWLGGDFGTEVAR